MPSNKLPAALRKFFEEHLDAEVSPWGFTAHTQLTRPNRTTKEYGVLLWWNVEPGDYVQLNDLWHRLCPSFNGKSAPRSSYMHAPAVRALEPKTPDLASVECYFTNTVQPLVFDSTLRTVEARAVKANQTARAIFTIQHVRRRPVPFLLGLQIDV